MGIELGNRILGSDVGALERSNTRDFGGLDDGFNVGVTDGEVDDVMRPFPYYFFF